MLLVAGEGVWDAILGTHYWCGGPSAHWHTLEIKCLKGRKELGENLRVARHTRHLRPPPHVPDPHPLGEGDC